jgi:hypothetical protein
MTNHWAIIVGINQYQSLQPLSFAQRDAQALQTCLVTEAGFMPERCILLTETAPTVWDHPTYPNREHINTWLDLLKQDLVQPGDWLWVFFSGYGVCWKGQDYLLPIDADPTALDRSAIPLRSLYERLKGLPTDRLLVLLDINRSQAIISGERVGIQTAELAREYGIATILSAQPDQFTQEAPDLGQGLFTAALLESLRFHKASPLESLEQYLSNRLPELSEHHYRPIQHPLISLGDPAQLQQATLPPVASTAEWNGSADDVLVGDAYATAPVETPPLDEDPWRLPEPAFAPIGATLGADVENPFVGSALTNLTGSDRPTPPPLVDSEEEVDDLPDPFFWQRFIWGIGVVASVLLFGVLIRNWSAIFGGQPTAPSPDQAGFKVPGTPLPAPVKSPAAAKPAATGLTAAKPTAAAPQSPAAKAPAKAVPAPAAPKAPVAATPVKPVKAPPKEPVKEPAKPAAAKPAAVAPGDRLATARALIKPSLASEANRAIALARQIPANDPQYAEAQREIDRWSQDILTIAQQRAAQKDYKHAIGAAQLVPEDRPQLHAEAQKAIAEWKKK